MKIIEWPYEIALKSLNDYTSLWLPDFSYYDQRKKSNGITISCFCSMAAYDLNVRSTREVYFPPITNFLRTGQMHDSSK